MTKQQLTRLFIVIAIIAAIVFVPYWAGHLAGWLIPSIHSDTAILSWLTGALFIYAGWIVLLVGLAILIIIPDFIKNGK